MKQLAQVDSPFKYVQVPTNNNAFGSPNNASVGSIISAVLPYLFGAAGILLLVYLVMAGLQMMMSRGNPKELEEAQHKITNALIGFVIIFFAFALVSIIGRVFGITVFGDIFK